MLESSDLMKFLHFHARRYNFSWSGPNSQGIVGFVPIMSPWLPEPNWHKIRSNSGKIMTSNAFYHENRRIRGIWVFWYFSSKAGPHNIVFASPRTHFMHMRVKNAATEIETNIKPVHVFEIFADFPQPKFSFLKCPERFCEKSSKNI